MHTPDGFVTGWICIVMLLLSFIVIALAVRNLRKTKAASIAAVAAIIFLAQMVNFPILGGTSGHLIGAAFALFVLGIEGAVIAMAAVLLVQTLAFGDGGLLSLGVNIFNMGIVAVYAANFVSQRIENSYVRTFAASWAAVVAASVACGIQLAASGVPLLAGVPAMAFTHSIIGFGEGFLTILMVSVMLGRLQNPSLRLALSTSGMAFLAVALLLPFASGAPDGLESVAIRLGFFENAMEYAAPFSYSLGVLAALVGAALAFILSYAVMQFSCRAASSPNA